MSRDWHSDEIQEAPLVDTQCTMFERHWLFGTISRCEEDSTHELTGVCVHEHGATWTTCERHALTDGRFCNACTDSTESHECPVRISVKPLASAGA